MQAATEHAQRKEWDPDIMVCPKCGSSFFTVEAYQQYRKDYAVVLGQIPPEHPSSPIFYFHKCICGEVIEPQVQYNVTSPMSKIYEKFINIVKKVLGDDENKK
jgi:hypothetical protein